MTYPPGDRGDHPEIQSPPTERLVPETERRVPTSRNTVLVLCIVATVLIIAGGVVGFPVDNELVGLILAAAGLIAAAVAWVMAYGDARTGAGMPAVATIVGAIVCVILALDLGEVEDAGTALDPGTLVAPDAADVPEDPAAIVNPDRAEDAPRPAR